MQSPVAELGQDATRPALGRVVGRAKRARHAIGWRRPAETRSSLVGGGGARRDSGGGSSSSGGGVYLLAQPLHVQLAELLALHQGTDPAVQLVYGARVLHSYARDGRGGSPDVFHLGVHAGGVIWGARRRGWRRGGGGGGGADGSSVFSTAAVVGGGGDVCFGWWWRRRWLRWRVEAEGLGGCWLLRWEFKRGGGGGR